MCRRHDSCWKHLDSAEDDVDFITKSDNCWTLKMPVELQNMKPKIICAS